jgi:glyoxylase-like metal-dependent hydrolase (beta-lactamase superfamily II)
VTVDAATEICRIVSGRLDENCYLVSRSADAVVVDPGGGFERLAAEIGARGVRVHAVLTTHGHVDHLAAAAPVVEAFAAPFHLHSADEGLLARANFYRRFIHDEDKIPIAKLDVPLDGLSSLRFGQLEVGVVHTPGHTPGSVCFRVGENLFTGDTVTAAHVGRTDLPGGDREALEASLTLLAQTSRPDATIRPGHGGPVRAGEVLGSWATLPELRG